MAPQQHLVLSWVLSNLNWTSRRDRIVATICGLIPDIDGLGLIIDKIAGDGSYNYYFLWHRKAGHSLLGVVVMGLIAYFICSRKIFPATVAVMAYLIHLFCDLIGSAGPDGSIWSIYFYWPFSDREAAVSWQWALNSWQNTLITAIFIIIVLIIAAKKKRSFLELFSKRLDEYCINTIERVIKRKTT